MNRLKKNVFKNKIRVCNNCPYQCGKYLGLACIKIGGTIDPFIEGEKKE